MKLEKWFAIPVWYDNTVFDFDSVSKYCLELAKTHSNRVLSNVGGWQSTDFRLEDHPKLLPVKEIIDQKIKEFSAFIGPNCKLRLDNCWLNINGPGSSNRKHVHPLSLFSGVIYISANDSSGDLVFHNESASIHYQEVANNESDLFFGTVTYKPKNGMIVMFPAWTSHSVTINESNDPRISIAFNVMQF